MTAKSKITIALSLILLCILFMVTGVYALNTAEVFLGGDMGYDGYVKDASYYTTLTFNYDTTAKTAAVAKNADNEPTGHLAIPSQVKYEGEIYTVTEVAQEGFENCEQITTVEFPTTLTTLRRNAFNYCGALTSVVIPSSVTTLVGNCFKGCSSIENIEVENDNSIYEDRESDAIIEKTTNTLITGCKTTVIPDSVTIIGVSAFFANDNLTTVTMPNTIVEIANAAFSGCSKLSSINLSTTLKTIGAGAFQNTALVEVTIPDSVETIGDSAFYNCTKLSSINLSTTLKTIGARAFENTALVEVTIPDSVETIGDNAFRGCRTLKKIAIGSGFKSLGATVFQATQLEEISVSSENTTYDSRSNCNAIIETATNILVVGSSSTVIPTDVVKIGESAFWGNESLTSITIPGNVKIIGENAFYGCLYLSLSDIVLKEGVETIEASAFFITGANAGSSTFQLPNSLTTIGDYVFSCAGLHAIKLGSGLTTIGKGVFSETGLSSAYYPGTEDDWNTKVTVDTGNDLLLNVLTFKES